MAYTSVIAKPKDQSVVLPLGDASVSTEYFGRLDAYPHTFDFEVTNKQAFKASIEVPDTTVQKNDISIIIVKAERRGVSEVGRTKISEQVWTPVYNSMYAESFKQGGVLEGELEPAWYKIEVSSPNNEGKYHLVWGTEKSGRGYFANVQALFEVKTFLGNSKWGALQSPLIYWPLGLLFLIGGYILYRKRNQRNVNTPRVPLDHTEEK